MSSPNKDEGSVWGVGSHPEGGEQAGGLGRTLGTPLPSSQDEGAFSDLEGFEDEEREVMEGVLWGCEGRPGSPADFDGGTLDYLADEAAIATLQQLTDRDHLAVRRNPSPESCCDSEASALSVDLQAGPEGRSAQAYGLVGSRRPSTARLPLMGPGGGRAWGNCKRAAKNRSKDTVGPQWSSEEGLVGWPSHSESSDDFSELHLLSSSLYGKGGGQAKPRSLQDTPRHSSVRAREKFLCVPGSFLPSAPPRLASVGARRRAVGELEVSRRKPQSVVCRKAGSRPSYLPGAAAAGSRPKATPGRKVAQEKKFLGGASKVAPQGTFPPWGQGFSAAALEPATFPPVAGGPVLGRGKGYSLVSLGTKQPKHTGAGQKSGARRKRGSLPVVVEEKEPESDPGPKVQTHSPGPSCRECNSGDGYSRAAGAPGQAQPWALSQGEVLPRGPTASRDQAPLGYPPAPERQQQPPGAEGCPRCPELQRQIYDLRQQLAAMQSLADKFRNL
ncbi:uncharacterized protein CXorf49 homolog [Myotis lucifugus]|uniref:uncharacterized protein CXorf49 homolog n=1 Tax=Myotis lucifugus TaxID=59463 RepID=UPI0003C44E98|nr:uncharacterized protein CXorf49 homolog [Myotis lucifugus]